MANTIPIDGRIWFTGTHASIGSGNLANWSRDTDFDGRFFQGSTVARINTTAATHTHTADAHTHTVTLSHSHNLTITGGASGSNTTNPASRSNQQPGAIGGHSHSIAFSNLTAHSNQNTTVTITGTDGRPPYTTAILIKPDDGLQDVPVTGVVMTKDASAPTGFSLTDGTYPTVDLNAQFLQAPTTGGDGGSTGGSATHTHAIFDHTHIQNAHRHSNSSFGQPTILQVVTSVGITFWQGVDNSHHEARSISSVAAINQNATGLVTNSASSEPSYTKLLGIQNTSGGSATADNIIIGYVGDSGSIPSSWNLCDGTSGTPDLTASQIKVTTNGAEVLDTGGSDTHTHSSGSSHTHTANAHTHIYTFWTGSDSMATGTGKTVSRDTHTHTSNSMSNATGSNNSNTITMSTDDGRYSRRTILFIMRTAVTVTDNAVFFGANF